MPDAVQKLNAHNTAVAMMSSQPPPVASLPLPSFPSHMPILAKPTLSIPEGSRAPVAPLPPTNALSVALAAAAAIGNVVGEGGAATKPHRQLYIGNLPPGVNVPLLTEFINTAMKRLGLAKDGQLSVVSVWVSREENKKVYAFVELRTIEETNGALAFLDKYSLGPYVIRVGRPKEYQGGAPLTQLPPIPGGSVYVALTGISLAGYVGGPPLPPPPVNNMMTMKSVPDTVTQSINVLSNVIMVGNIPTQILEEQIKELISFFGSVSL